MSKVEKRRYAVYGTARNTYFREAMAESELEARLDAMDAFFGKAVATPGNLPLLEQMASDLRTYGTGRPHIAQGEMVTLEVTYYWDNDEPWEDFREWEESHTVGVFSDEEALARARAQAELAARKRILEEYLHGGSRKSFAIRETRLATA